MASTDRRSLLRAAGLGLGAFGLGLMPRSTAFAQGAAGSFAPLVLGEAKGAGQSAQFVIGAKGGLFKKHGLDVTLRIFGSGAEMGPALVAGSLNVISTGDVPGIPIMAAGAPIKALCPLSDFSADQAIVTRSDIKEAKDLVGKKIALYKGSVASLLIERYAAHHKVDAAKISLIHMDPLQQLPALANGDIDGYVSWEPHIWSGTKRIPNSHVLARANDPVQYIRVFGLLLARQDYLDANKEAMRRLIAALAEGNDMLRSGDAAVHERTAHYIREVTGIDLPVETLVEMMKRRTYTMAIDKGFVEAQNVNSQFLLDMGRIKKKPEVLSWLDPEPLRSVRPDLVTL